MIYIVLMMQLSMQSDKGYDDRYMPSIAQTQKCRPCGCDFSVSYFIWQFSLHDMNEPMISIFSFSRVIFNYTDDWTKTEKAWSRGQMTNNLTAPNRSQS